MRATELRMSDLDARLQKALHRRQQLGVVDVKWHVEVTTTTDPQDFKRALLNVLEQGEEGAVAQRRVNEFKSFGELYGQID